MIEQFLKLNGGLFSLVQEDMSLPADICRIKQTALFALRKWESQIVGNRRLESLECLRRVPAHYLNVAANRG